MKLDENGYPLEETAPLRDPDGEYMDEQADRYERHLDRLAGE